MDRLLKPEPLGFEPLGPELLPEPLGLSFPNRMAH